MHTSRCFQHLLPCEHLSDIHIRKPFFIRVHLEGGFLSSVTCLVAQYRDYTENASLWAVIPLMRLSVVIGRFDVCVCVALV